MAILVTGSTGVVGSQVLAHLGGKKGVEVRALTRSPDKAQLPAGVKAVQGDLADVDSFRKALDGVSTLFLLVPNVADELTQAMQALTLAHEAGVKGIVYLSVFKGDAYADAPHFASKNTVEQMIEALDLPATILRPAYFIQNDLRQKDLLLNAGVYGMPIGQKGISMVDVRDIGEAAALELLRREQAAFPLPRETYALVGPDIITAREVSAIWSEALDRPINHAGDDLQRFEGLLKTMMPAWLALDMRVMFGRYQSDGAIATADDVSRLSQLLGRKPRSYRDFARDAAAQWRAQ
ncbi:NmrA/HSCARG family protein [Dyella humi]|uniref:NmrA/HSCARG family protein n=1 Tax=Dyella humi TaxID=1770547 RepID=A0ABW8IIF5_9GAMM